jgi:predicted membrane-bound spermidine synthase
VHPSRSDGPRESSTPTDGAARPAACPPWLFLVFFLSGAAALIYQLVWQRVLFTIYGVDTASVTLVVTAFLLGLGVGSLAGGWLSRRCPDGAVTLFAAFELGIGAFGASSLWLFDAAASFTLGASHLVTGLVTFLLVLVPTTLMGATLPLLVGHVARRSGNVGRAVGDLYFVNTMGAAAGAFAAAGLLMGALGLAHSVAWAAGLNVTLGLGVLALSRAGRPRR